MSNLVTSSGFPLMKLFNETEVWLVVKNSVPISILLSMNLSSTHTCSSFTALLEYQHLFLCYTDLSHCFIELRLIINSIKFVIAWEILQSGIYLMLHCTTVQQLFEPLWTREVRIVLTTPPRIQLCIQKCIPYFPVIKCMHLYLHGTKTCTYNSEVCLTKVATYTSEVACAFMVSFKGCGQSHNHSRCCIPPGSKWHSLLEEPEIRQ